MMAEVIKRLEKFPKLHTLNLNSNPIMDTGLAYLSKLSHLVKLYISNTQITSSGIICLKIMPNLRFIDISQNLVIGEPIQELLTINKNLVINAKKNLINDHTILALKERAYYFYSQQLISVAILSLYFRNKTLETLTPEIWVKIFLFVDVENSVDLSSQAQLNREKAITFTFNERTSYPMSDLEKQQWKGNLYKSEFYKGALFFSPIVASVKMVSLRR